MTSTQADVVAYVHDCEAAAVLDLLSASVGVFEQVGEIESDLAIYSAGPFTLVLEPGENNYTSVWLRGPAPWQTCVSFARHLAAQLGKVVLCDPGDEFPDVSVYSDTFLEIGPGGERLVHLEN